jgi:hypothetical protein
MKNATQTYCGAFMAIHPYYNINSYLLIPNNADATGFDIMTYLGYDQS